MPKRKRQAALIIEQVRSPIGRPSWQREVLRGLGLRRIGQRVRRPDTPEVRGAIDRVRHLVRVEVEEAGRGAGGKR